MSQMKSKTDRGLYDHGAVTSVLILALILLFAALSIALIVLGAQAYDAVCAAAEGSAQKRATVSYVLSKLRAHDGIGDVGIETIELDDETVCVLTLEEEIEGESYHTRIYCAEGELREQTVPGDILLESAQDGERIASLTAFEAYRDGQLLFLRFVHGDEEQTVHAALHSGGGDAR